MAEEAVFDWDGKLAEMIEAGELPSDLNPGIRKTVTWLRLQGFETVDSGDGKTHDCCCDSEAPYVVMWVEPEEMALEADLLFDLLREAGIEMKSIPPSEEDAVAILGMEPEAAAAAPTVPWLEATYDPANGDAFLYLANVDDALLFREGAVIPLPEWPGDVAPACSCSGDCCVCR